MQKSLTNQLLELSVLFLLTFAILWKGGKTLESTWLLLGVSALCIIFQYLKNTKGHENEKNADMWGLLMMFILWTCGSYLLSQTQNYGLDEVLRTAGLIFIFLWCLNRDEDKSESKPQSGFIGKFVYGSFEERFFSLLAFVTVLSCIIGIAVYAAQPVNRFVGTFFDFRFHTDYWPNACAQFLLLTWPVVLIVSGRRIRKGRSSLIKYHIKDKLIRYVPIGFVLGCLLLTYSRGALIAFVGQIALLTILLWKRKGTGKKLVLPLRHIAAALLLGFLVFISINELRSNIHPVQSVTEKVTFSADEGKSSVDERSSFWKQASTLTIKRPIVGWGPYSFRFVQPRMQEHVLATSDHPHNVFLKFAMERGVPAMIFFMMFLFIIFKNSTRLALTGKRMEEKSDHARFGYVLLLTGVAGVFAHNLIDYNLQFVGVSMPLWITMAILMRHANANLRTVNIKSWWNADRRRVVTMTITLILLAVAIREGMYLTTSSFGRHAEAKGETEEAIKWFERSENEWFTRDLRLSLTHQYLNAGEAEKASESLEKYLSRNSEDARGWKLLGEIYMLNDDYPNAIKSFEQAFKLGGWNDIGISRGLLEALFAETYTQPTSDAAADSKRLPLHPRIIELLPEIEARAESFAEAIQNNTHFIALSPNVEEAVKVLIMLSVLHPEKVNEFREMERIIEIKADEERKKLKSRPPGLLW